MLASGNGNDDTDSQVVLGVANVHVDTVLLKKDTSYAWDTLILYVQRTVSPLSIQTKAFFNTGFRRDAE